MKKALRRLTLHNFQSHEDTNLELSAGVNIIVGPSDVGKTSIIRGLRWLYYNQPRGSSFIRMGTSECWVEVETEDNIIVRRYRNDVSRKNGYLLVVPEQEPVVFEKHGASVPDEIKLALGVEDMVIDQDVVLNLNIAYQLEGAFLLETPGTTRAKAIGRLGDAHIVDAAQREIQKDLRAISQDIEKKKSQLSGEEQLLAKYSHLSSWANQLEKLNSLFAKHEKLVNLAKNLSDLQIRYDKNQLALNELLPVLNKLIGIEQMQSCLEQLQAARLKEEKLNTLNRQFETKKNDHQIFVRILQVTSRLTVGQDLLARLFELSIAAKLYSELNQKLNDSRWRLQQAERIILTTTNLEVVDVKVATSHNKYRLVLAYDQLYRDYTNKNQRLKTAVQQLQGTCKLLPAEKSLDHLLRLREL
ncbi:MAG: AAA family ATPase, partial [Methylocystaceae bacterium]